MSDDFDDYDGLIDDDPALDYIMYKKMTREEQQGPDRKNSGCLVLLLVPAVSTGLYLIRDLLA